MNDDHSSTEVYDIPDHPLYKLGDIITTNCVKYNGISLELQGRIMTMYSTDVKGDNVFFGLHMLYRPDTRPRDIIKKNSCYIYEYWESDEYVDVSAKDVIAVIPSTILVEGCDPSYSEFAVDVDEKLLSKGFIYISKSVDSNQIQYPPCQPEVTLAWHHFDHESFTTHPDTLDKHFWGVLKELVFDVFVSPISKSYRRRSPHKNRRLWDTIVANFASPEMILVGATESLLDTDRMYLDENCLKHICDSIHLMMNFRQTSAGFIIRRLSDRYHELEAIRDRGYCLEQGCSLNEDLKEETESVGSTIDPVIEEMIVNKSLEEILSEEEGSSSEEETPEGDDEESTSTDDSSDDESSSGASDSEDESIDSRVFL